MPLALADVVEVFDCSHFVHYDEDTMLFFVWNGSLTMNIYDSSLNAVNCFMTTEAPNSRDEVSDWCQRIIDYLMEAELV